MPARPAPPVARALDLDGADAAAWDDLARRAPERSPFATRAYLGAIAEAAGLRAGAVGVFGSADDGEADRLVAALPTFERRRGPLRCSVVPPVTFYTPLLTDPPVREGAVLLRQSPLDALLAEVTRRFDLAAFHLAPTTMDVRAFTWAGFTASPLYTYAFAPAAPYKPAQDVGRRLRLGAGLHAGPVPTDDAALHRLVRVNFDRPGRRPPFSVEAQRRLFARLDAAGLLETVATGPAEGEPVDGAFALLHDDAGSYAWLIGSPKGPAATVLIDRTLRAARAAGRVYDLFGANTPSISLFKKAFGGALVPFYRVVWARGQALRAFHAVRPLV